MKKVFLFLILIMFADAALAGYEFTSLLFVPWGDNEQTVRFETSPGGQFGPTAFRVSGDEIQILDARNQSVKIFKDNKVVRTLPFRCETADDFIVGNGSLYLLSSNRVEKHTQNKALEIFDTRDFRDRINGLFLTNRDNIVMPANSGKTYYLNTAKKDNTEILEGIVLQEERSVQIRFSPGNPVRVYLNNRQAFRLNFENPGLVRLIGTDRRGDLYFYIERILQGAPLKVERFILVTTELGFEHSRIRVPVYMWTEIFREFQVDDDGNIYHMMSTEDGIRILGWIRNGRGENTYREYAYPERLDKEFHFNQLIDETWETKPVNPQTAPASKGVTRTEALAIADTYVEHIWNCRAENLTNGRITVGGVEVETPSWIQIGQNQKVPYKWGGFHTLDQYDSGLLSNKYAGDIATSGVSSSAVGVDCSGYVSRCWKLSSHYATSMMNSTPSLFTKIADWNQFLPADALHKVGHVRLGVVRNTDGSILAVEAAGSSTGWKVDYRNYTLSNLTDYTLLKYTGISGGAANLSQPELLSVVSVPGDSVKITWTPFNSDGDETGIKIVFETLEGAALTYSDTTLSLDFQSVVLPKPADPVFVTLVSVDDDENESIQSDTYGTAGTGNDHSFLIVDGFTRTGSGASYVLPYHNFALTPAEALSQWNLSYNTCAAKTVASGSIDLNVYPAVFWNAGDESTIDESFSDAEQALIKTYLKQGGRFAATGSEIGWDLDNKGSASDKDFIQNYLKAAYLVDDAGSVPVKILSGPFAGDYVQYDDGSHGVYQEDYPDGFTPVNGGTAFLEYQSNPRYVAGVTFNGTVPGGSSECYTALIGFPIETVWDKEEQLVLMRTLLYVLGYDELVTGNTSPPIPDEFRLEGNYPNPFNAATVIRFNLPEPSDISLTVFDLAGRQIYTEFHSGIRAGKNSLTLNFPHLSSGIYIYTLSDANSRKNLYGKMTLLK